MGKAPSVRLRCARGVLARTLRQHMLTHSTVSPPDWSWLCVSASVSEDMAVRMSAWHEDEQKQEASHLSCTPACCAPCVLCDCNLRSSDQQRVVACGHPLSPHAPYRHRGVRCAARRRAPWLSGRLMVVAPPLRPHTGASASSSDDSTPDAPASEGDGDRLRAPALPAPLEEEDELGRSLPAAEEEEAVACVERRMSHASMICCAHAVLCAHSQARCSATVSSAPSTMPGSRNDLRIMHKMRRTRLGCVPRENLGAFTRLGAAGGRNWAAPRRRVLGVWVGTPDGVPRLAAGGALAWWLT